MSIKLLRTFYQSVDEAWCFGEQATPPQAPATGYELGVLVPGHPWRKGVPLGRHTQAVGGGMVIEDYSEPDQDLTTRVAAVLVVEEHEVPFPDLDADELYSLRPAARSSAPRLTPVPLFVDDDEHGASHLRPGGQDLRWMSEALPAISAFLLKHGAELSERLHADTSDSALATQADGGLHLDHAHKGGLGSGVYVCWPPPSIDQWRRHLMERTVATEHG